MAARVISRTRVREHITPVLVGLHLLSVQHRIHYKILLLTYKVQHGLAPGYVSELLQSYQPARTLRSTTQGQRLSEPRVATSWGERAFSRAAPVLWTGVPSSLYKMC